MKFLITFVLGAVLGAAALHVYLGAGKNTPRITFTGKAELDTATHADTRLNNAVLLRNASVPGAKLYLRFADNNATNRALGKNVKVSGQLRMVKLDNGDAITELVVHDVQPAE